MSGLREMHAIKNFLTIKTVWAFFFLQKNSFLNRLFLENFLCATTSKKSVYQTFKVAVD